MFTAALYEQTRQVLKALCESDVLAGFYLAGGTALALQLGHRKSIDLDFFSKSYPDKELLLQKLQRFNPQIIQNTTGTLDVIISGVKVSFLAYNYNLLEPLIDFEGCQLASVVDIACMKLTAISSRGSRKDFIDLFFILKTISLIDLLDRFSEKYAGITYNSAQILKSLTYFIDAEQDPEPDYISAVSWTEIKDEIVEQVSSILKK